MSAKRTAPHVYVGARGFGVNVTIGMALRLVKHRRRWSTLRLANVIGVNPATIERWLKGAVPRRTRHVNLIRLLYGQTQGVTPPCRAPLSFRTSLPK